MMNTESALRKPASMEQGLTPNFFNSEGEITGSYPQIFPTLFFCNSLRNQTVVDSLRSEVSGSPLKAKPMINIFPHPRLLPALDRILLLRLYMRRGAISFICLAKISKGDSKPYSLKF